MRLLTRDEIAQKLGIKTYTAVKEIIESENFPKPVQVPASKRQKWVEADIDAWIANLPKRDEKEGA